MNPLDAVRETAAELGLPGARVLVAASGGVDSSVLLHALHALADELRLELVVAHINHGLRGADSDADEAWVAMLAAELGWRFVSRRVAPDALRAGRSSRERPTLLEACRRSRYDALFELMAETGCRCIATAHTLDDQAETVLLRLVRGAGPSGLGGIPPRSHDGRVLRPLLCCARSAIEHWARERGLGWREDASNRNPATARARLRQAGVFAWAERENPAWLRAVAGLAEAQRREEAWIEGIVAREASLRITHCGEGRRGRLKLRITAQGWDALPDALALRIARFALRSLGGGRDVSRTHLQRMVAFWRTARPGTRIELPGGVALCRERTAFHLWRSPHVAPTGLPDC